MRPAKYYAVFEGMLCLVILGCTASKPVSETELSASAASAPEDVTTNSNLTEESTSEDVSDSRSMCVPGMGFATIQASLQDHLNQEGELRRYLCLGVHQFGFPSIGVKSIRVDLLKTNLGELEVTDEMAIQHPFTLANTLNSDDAAEFRCPIPKTDATTVEIEEVTLMIPILKGTDLGKFQIDDIREAAASGVTDPLLKKIGLRIAPEESPADDRKVFRITYNENYAIKNVKTYERRGSFFQQNTTVDYASAPKGDSVAVPHLASFAADANEFIVKGTCFSDITVSVHYVTFYDLIATLETP